MASQQRPVEMFGEHWRRSPVETYSRESLETLKERRTALRRMKGSGWFTNDSARLELIRELTVAIKEREGRASVSACSVRRD